MPPRTCHPVSVSQSSRKLFVNRQGVPPRCSSNADPRGNSSEKPRVGVRCFRSQCVQSLAMKPCLPRVSLHAPAAQSVCARRRLTLRGARTRRVTTIPEIS
eukprot:3739778-Prymnesium_polylepis.1